MKTARFAVVAVVAAAALALVGCSGGATPTASDSSSKGGAAAPLSKMTHITVGSLAIVDTAPLYLGIQQGFFKKENLDVDAQVASGGAALLPAVVSGDDQFGFSEVASLVTASSKGLPIQIVSAGDSSNGDRTLGKDYNEVLVAPGSSIKDVKDLQGKKVATNSLTNINYVDIRAAVDAAGGDSSKVDFVEIAFPDQVNALLSGQVDAIAAPEPFHTLGISKGAKPIYQTYSATPIVGAWFTSSPYAQQHPDVVAAFTRAIQKSLKYAADNPDAVRAIVPTYTQITADGVKNIALPGYTPLLDESSLKDVIKQSKKYGLVQGDVDLPAFLGSTPTK